MLSTEQLTLLQKYVDKELSAQEEATFNEYLATDEAFAKEVDLERLINETLQQPATRARIIFNSLSNELDAQTSGNTTAYTLTELLQMFAPAPDLEASIATRSADSGQAHGLQNLVALPENGINCHNALFFALDEPVASPLRCEIFDNKCAPIIEKEIPANELSFEVEFSLPPGRYYWELTPTDRQIRRSLDIGEGMFLVDEHLMPTTARKDPN